MNPQIVLIGPGRVGCAVCKRLCDAGYKIRSVVGRNLQRCEEAVRFIGCDPQAATTNLAQAGHGDVILLGLPDDQIASMAKKLREAVALTDSNTLVHFSGLHPASIMSVANSTCASVSIHPLLPFADREMALDNLKGCPCAIEGDDSALTVATSLVTAIGGQEFHLPSDCKNLYHAAACITSNYLVTLTAIARDLLLHCGFNRQQAMELLIPINQATSTNLTRLGPETALTGPIVRGDEGTVRSHLTALKETTPDLLELYTCLGEQTADLAADSGRLKKEQADNLRQLFQNFSNRHSKTI